MSIVRLKFVKAVYQNYISMFKEGLREHLDKVYKSAIEAIGNGVGIILYEEAAYQYLYKRLASTGRMRHAIQINRDAVDIKLSINPLVPNNLVYGNLYTFTLCSGIVVPYYEWLDNDHIIHDNKVYCKLGSNYHIMSKEKYEGINRVAEANKNGFNMAMPEGKKLNEDDIIAASLALQKFGEVAKTFSGIKIGSVYR